MFWRRKSKSDSGDVSDLMNLATKLGVERRQNVRLRYPTLAQLSFLPRVEFAKKEMQVQDISVGGVCLRDPKEVLTTPVGHDTDLILHWPDASEVVRSRIAAHSDTRRHVQFLNLPENRHDSLKASFTRGARGFGIRAHSFYPQPGIVIDASELWSSLNGDAITFKSDMHIWAEISYDNQFYKVYRESWPRNEKDQACTVFELENLIFFLANVPAPTHSLGELYSALQYFLTRGLK